MSLETAVDICPEKMDAADAEAPRIETEVEEATMLSFETAVDICPAYNKKNRQKQEAAGEC